LDDAAVLEIFWIQFAESMDRMCVYNRIFYSLSIGFLMFLSLTNYFYCNKVKFISIPNNFKLFGISILTDEEDVCEKAVEKIQT